MTHGLEARGQKRGSKFDLQLKKPGSFSVAESSVGPITKAESIAYRVSLWMVNLTLFCIRGLWGGKQ